MNACSSSIIIGVFNLCNQLSNLPKNWGMQGSKTEFHEFHAEFTTYLQFKSKSTSNSTISTGKHEKLLEINLEIILETML